MKEMTLLENVFNLLLQSKTKKSLHCIFFSFTKAFGKNLMALVLVEYCWNLLLQSSTVELLENV